LRPSFNTAGPCIPGEHYMLPPGRRLGRVLELIGERKYFTLHSGRQTGKTTSAFWLVEHACRQADPDLRLLSPNRWQAVTLVG
jgi:hypothetical protein